MTSTLSQLLFIYILGGLTFVPLLLAAVLVPAWLALPKAKDGGQKEDKTLKDQDGGDEKTAAKLKLSQEERDGEDGTASGTFAVLRKYDLPAATAALTARNGGHQAGGAGTGVEGAADGVGGSESVYQSMYRSVFDRSRTTTPPNALSNTSDDENATAADARTRRKVSKPAPANVYFIVLRHGHLMLYDSPTQIEVRHVISLAHHRVSMSDGEEGGIAVEEPMTDGDLFIKRTAILLTPLTVGANGTMQTQALPPKPFYLFTSTSIQKESFYHALVLASPLLPTPQPLDPHDLIKLQTSLHSTLITAETRALNAIISRIFLALSGTDQLKDFFRAKIEKKISRVQKPGFINALALQAIELGAAAPVVANLRLKDLNISGDVTISCDVRYTGGISLAFAAQARLDLGPRFKARTVDLLLSSSLKRLSGHMLIRIKPPPSNRLWFSFDGMPDMEIKFEPVVSSRQITYGFILRQIEEKIRAIVAETLVKPNWDDISFFDTRSQNVRGGIWAREGDNTTGGDSTPTDAEMLAKRGEKTMSMPVLPHMDAETEGASSGTETPRRDRDAELKRRSVISLPPPTSSTPHLATIDSEERVSSSSGSRPLRSPSLTSPSASAPSVALDDSSANFDPSHKPPPQKSRTWGRRHVASPPTRKEAVDAVREMRDRSLHTQDTEVAGSGSEAVGDRGLVSEDDDGDMDIPDRTNTGFSTASAASSASASTAGTASSVKSENARQKKAANLLAAATTATTAAKNWSWNAIQNRAAKNAAGRRLSEAPSAPSPQEPMGRGQPLPPPGTPLPGPQKDKSLWTGSGFGVPGLSGSVKRKPLLPRRPVEKAYEEPIEAGKTKDAGVVDEFGDWAENSGDLVGRDAQSTERQGVHPVKEKEKKVPPPLPKRRRAEGESGIAGAEGGDREESMPSHALDAARLATSTPYKPNTSHDAIPPAAELDKPSNSTPPADRQTLTAVEDMPASSNPSAEQVTTRSEEPTALPAKPATSTTISQTQASNSDPEDLVVVAAPVESGRNTPLPSGEAAEEKLPRYDGEEWGGYADDDDDGYGYGYDRREENDEDEEDEDEDDGEGIPKASFSRSRGDGDELHQ